MILYLIYDFFSFLYMLEGQLFFCLVEIIFYASTATYMEIELGIRAGPALMGRPASGRA